MTDGAVHITDYTNAARTMLYDIRKLDWDDTILETLDIPRAILPEVRDSSGIYGTAEIAGHKIPIAGIAGDQQAALFGQTCFNPGDAKNTYGTGCFLLMNTGDAEYYAHKVPDTGGVYMVPAFTGLGAPHWDMYARGCIVGLTRGTRREHIIRAAEESIAYQVADLVCAMELDTGLPLSVLKADGGASRDGFLMQFQADILNTAVSRPAIRETTPLGAAYLAGLAAGIWKDREELGNMWACDRVFHPQMEDSRRELHMKDWKRALNHSRGWAK